MNDVPDLLEMMRHLLRQSGYRVLTASDGQEGFEIARAERPRLIVSDVSMPRVDGIEMCRLIRSLPDLRTTPVLLVSAVRKDSESVLEGLRAGADDYLEAPYDPMRLITTVARLIERAGTEEALRESQARLAGIVDSAMDAIITVDEGQRILLFNRAAEKMFRCAASEAIGQQLDRFIPERFRTAHTAHIQSFGRTGVTTRAMAGARAVYGLRADGEEFPVEASISQVEAGGQKLYTVIMRDITERQRTEEKLSLLAAIIESSNDAIIGKNLDGTILSWNPAAERLYGYTPAEVVGRSVTMLIPPDLPDEEPRIIEQIKRGESVDHYETVRLRKDGTRVDVSLTVSPLKDAQGRIIGASKIARDITERKRAEEALREQAKILDLAPVLIRDLSARIVFWNSGAEQMYGWRQEEALGKVSHSLLRTEFPQPLEEINAKLFAYGHWEGELVQTRRDGKPIVVASHWVLHRDEHDKPRAVLVVNNDITKSKQAEKEIRRLNEELEQRVAERTAQLEAANRELEAFSYSVSHDLRAPLRHINGFSQALLEDYADKLDEGGKGYLQQVCDASREMAQLIDDVLQLARVTRSEMRREVVDLSELARAVVAELQKADAGRAVAVSIEEGLSAHGDRRLLRVVLDNLLGNAWKFTSRRERAEIAVGCERKGGETVYFVRDNGAGFDMAYVKKLFGTFQRLHSGEEFEGTGIGLATVQRIVNRHGGRVWAEGAIDQGATFYFTLPGFQGA
ncbi:MAG TPA: PAS domain S-box protein [Pyrinomonadaceae bacterium]|nr:PAS domain S-box protein [Pyrinomonadaceae bacterium]